MSIPADTSKSGLFLKIIGVAKDGQLYLNEETFQRFLEETDTNEKFLRAPVSVISITGPKLSGKSLFTNLLIHALENDDWVKSVTKNVLKPYPVEPPCESSSPEESRGVYFYSKVFQISDGYNENNNRNLIIMDTRDEAKSVSSTVTIDFPNILEVLLHVASTQLIEIVYNQKPISHILNEQLDESGLDNKLCESIFYIIRRRSETGAVRGHKISLHDEELVDKWGNLMLVNRDYSKLLNFFSKVKNDSGTKKLEYGNLLSLTNLKQHLTGSLCIINAHVESKKKIGKSHCLPLPSKRHLEEVETLAKQSQHTIIKTKVSQLSHIAALDNFHAKFEAALIANLTNWINDSLSLENLEYCNIVFEDTHQKVFEDIISTNHLSNEYRGLLANYLEEKTKQFNEFCVEVGRFFSKFHLDAKEFLVNHTLESEAISEEILEHFIRTKLNEQTYCDVNLIRKGCKHIANITRDLIRSSTLKMCTNQVIDLYDKQIRLFLEQQVLCNPQNFQLVHCKLSKELISAVSASIFLHPADIQKLKQHLATKMKTFQAKQLEALEAAQKRVNSLISKYKSQYEVTMDELLQNYTHSTEIDLLRDSHIQVRCNVLEKFQNEFIVELPNEPLSEHSKTLSQHITNSFKFILDDFNHTTYEISNLDIEETLDVDAVEAREPPNSVKPETELPLTPTQELDYNKKPNRSFEHNLLYHVCMEEIGVVVFDAQNYKFKLTNAATYIEGSIGITVDDKWVYGSEVKTLVQTSEYELRGNWLLRDIFSLPFKLPADYPLEIWQEELLSTSDGPKVQTITAALVIGKLLDHLKYLVIGSDMSSRRAIFTVPFWFTTFQRQLIFDGAKIAGFKKIEILNENSAVAYNMYTHRKKLENLVVITESSGIFDLSIYGFDQISNTISMKAHSAAFELDKMSKSIFDHFKSFFNWILVPKAEKEKKKHKESLERIWNISKDMVHHRLSNTIKVVVCGKTKELTDLLYKTARKSIAQPDINIIIDDEIALVGAMEMSCDRSNHSFIEMDEGLACPLAVMGATEVFVNKIEKFSTFEANGIIDITIPNKVGCYIFYQKFFNTKYFFGQLDVNKLRDSLISNLNVTLRLTRNGMLEFLSVSNLDNFNWCSFALAEYQIVDFKNLVEQSLVQTSNSDAYNRQDKYDPVTIEPIEQGTSTATARGSEVVMPTKEQNSSVPSKNPENPPITLVDTGDLKRQSAEIAQKAELLQACISRGDGAFENSIVRNLALRSIGDNLSDLKSNNFTINDLNKIEQQLKCLSLQYNLKYD